MKWSVIFDGTASDTLIFILKKSGCAYGYIVNADQKVVGIRIRAKTGELRLTLGKTLEWDALTGVMKVLDGPNSLL